MAMNIEVLGRNQTERLIHLALTTQGKLTSADLYKVVGGSQEYSERTLRSMVREGLIRHTWVAIGQRGFEALTSEQCEQWLIPHMTWKRFGNEFTGSRIGTGHWNGSDGSPIKTVAKLRDQLQRFRAKTWFTLGDERAIIALFPELTGGNDATA
jgi:hypothetical protein